jgi:hypothetical protein
MSGRKAPSHNGDKKGQEVHASLKCKECGRRETINTVEAAKDDSWPVCCGEYMEESGAVRNRYRSS